MVTSNKPAEVQGDVYELTECQGQMMLILWLTFMTAGNLSIISRAFSKKISAVSSIVATKSSVYLSRLALALPFTVQIHVRSFVGVITMFMRSHKTCRMKAST